MYAMNEKIILEVLNAENPFARQNKLGHITASGLVIRDSKVLLIFHPFIKQWIQPGGHIDDGELPIEAAIREVYEETGVVCSSGFHSNRLIDIDIHEIPANSKKGEDCHLHIDLLYELQFLRQEKSSENILWDWFPSNQIENTRIRRAMASLSP
jgi:8-oxo-dGTP pyrophosphatase MutT (NUDIX family)